MSDLPDGISDLSDEIELPEEVSRAVEQSTATPHTYDRRLVQDHTDLLLNAIARLNRPDQYKLLGDAGLMSCVRPRCRSQTYRILTGPKEILACSQCMNMEFRLLCSTVDNHLQIFCHACKASFPPMEIAATGGRRELPQHIQAICFNTDCGAAYPVLEVSPVQMNDRIAKAHGLYIPDPRDPRPVQPRPQDPRSRPKAHHPWRNPGRGYPGRN